MLPLKNDYALLAVFLRPSLDEATKQALRSAAASGAIDWGRLLYVANSQLCTPLWFVRLRQSGLLALLPDELQEYLGQLHQANIERNVVLRDALEELLQAFAREGIAPLLLKGAATFADDLYGDPGARMMGDLDLLVEARHTNACREILFAHGYDEVPEPNMEPDGLPTDERHHHLFPFRRPGSPVLVEVHFKVSYAQAGRVLPVAQAWANQQAATVGGVSVSLFNPTWRLLHNTAHALVPHCEFIRGDISLRQLAEFAALVDRDGPLIDWDEWFARGAAQGLKREFSVYLMLAQRLMGVTPTIKCDGTMVTRAQLARILTAGSLEARLEGQATSIRERLQAALVRSYYFLSLPLWVWRNVCYAPRKRQLPVRIGYLMKKILSPSSRGKI